MKVKTDVVGINSKKRVMNANRDVLGIGQRNENNDQKRVAIVKADMIGLVESRDQKEVKTDVETHTHKMNSKTDVFGIFVVVNVPQETRLLNPADGLSRGGQAKEADGLLNPAYGLSLPQQRSLHQMDGLSPKGQVKEAVRLKGLLNVNDGAVQNPHLMVEDQLLNPVWWIHLGMSYKIL
jgi:hypothetical protein